MLLCMNFDEILTTGQASLCTFPARTIGYLLGRATLSFAAQNLALIRSQFLHVHSADNLPIESRLKVHSSLFRKSTLVQTRLLHTPASTEMCEYGFHAHHAATRGLIVVFSVLNRSLTSDIHTARFRAFVNLTRLFSRRLSWCI